MAHFEKVYPGETLSKEDLFYYFYGLLHSPEYRTRYADNLSKELPRIPSVKKAKDFWAYSKAGRELAHWHFNYETVAPYATQLDTGKNRLNNLTPEPTRRAELSTTPTSGLPKRWATPNIPSNSSNASSPFP